MADQRITQLNPLLAADAQATVDVLPIADVSTSETKKITIADAVSSALVGGVSDGTIPGAKLQPDTVTALEIAPDAVGASELADGAVDTAAIIDSAITEGKLGAGAVTTGKLADLSVTDAKIADATVTYAKLNLADGTVPGAKIAVDSLTATQIAPNAIGSSELADNSVDTASLQDNAVSTQKIEANAVTRSKLALNSVGDTEIIDGSVLTAKLAASAVVTAKIADGAVTSAKLAANAVTEPAISADAVTTVKIQDGAVTASKLANDLDGSEFLPQIAGAALIGPATGTTGIPSFRRLSPTDIPVLTAANLPIASSTQLGGVQVGTGLTADGSGILSIANTVTGSTSSKVTFNSNGLITGAAALTPADIPLLDASQIASGVFSKARLPDGEIDATKLAPYSISYIQEAEPAIVDPLTYISKLWLQESTGQLRMYNGNSWFPVGFGRLSQENLRFAGLVDANTGTITIVTDLGTQAGLQVGLPVPAASNALSGAYLVVEVPGSNIGETPGVVYDNGDWVLCIDQAQGWTRIDTLSGGGGGGGAQRLNDLLDVDITLPASGDTLFYDPTSATWKNTSTTGVKATLAEPFDGTRTQFTLSKIVRNQNNIIVSVGGILQEPNVDYTVSANSSTISFATAPEAGLDYWCVIKEVSVAGGGGGGTTLPDGTAANEYLQWNNTLGTWQPSAVLDGGIY